MLRQRRAHGRPVVSKRRDADLAGLWSDCYTVLLAGGGVTGGAVYGASDKLGAYPDLDPVTPGDLAATIFSLFGIDPATEIHDALGRPYRVADGRPARSLFGGAI